MSPYSFISKGLYDRECTLVCTETPHLLSGCGRDGMSFVYNDRLDWSFVYNPDNGWECFAVPFGYKDRYFVSDKYGFQIPVIYKNAYSSLVQFMAGVECGLAAKKGRGHLHDLVREDVLREDYTPGLRNIVVWRDPVERFLSLINFNRQIGFALGKPNNLETVRRDREHGDIVIEAMLTVAYLITRSKSNRIDRHLDLQSRRLSRLDKFDIVQLQDLSVFFETQYGLKDFPISNISFKYFSKEDISLYVNRIKSIYKADYDFMETNKDRIWQR